MVPRGGNSESGGTTFRSRSRALKTPKVPASSAVVRAPAGGRAPRRAATRSRMNPSSGSRPLSTAVNTSSGSGRSSILASHQEAAATASALFGSAAMVARACSRALLRSNSIPACHTSHQPALTASDGTTQTTIRTARRHRLIMVPPTVSPGVARPSPEIPAVRQPPLHRRSLLQSAESHRPGSRCSDPRLQYAKNRTG